MEVKHSYNLLMNADENPFWRLPKAQRFQVMMWLSMMWTVIFSIGIGTFSFFGHLVGLHLLVLIGVVLTSWTFSRTEQGSDSRNLVA